LSRSSLLRALAVVAVAVVLRPPIAAVGPVLADVRSDLGLSAGAVSLLTALPVLFFGLGAFAGPWAAERLGMERALGVVLGVLTVAAVARVTAGPAVLFVGTVVTGAAIAVANVLLPAVVKADFPRHVGLMTGVYTGALSGAAALAALVAVPVAGWRGLGWRGSLGLWGVVAAVALVLWLPQLLRRDDPAVTLAAPHPARRLLRNGCALAVTAYMGFQSLGFYAVLTWLPSLLTDHGYSPTAAGALLSLVTVLGIPVGLALPTFAASLLDQRLLAAALSAVTAAGFAGLLIAPTTGTLAWVVLVGLGLGGSFPMALLLIALRSSSPAVTGQLSAMAQGFGYLLAAAGPFVVGALREAAGGWGPPLVLLLGCTAVQTGAGWLAGRAGTAA
jgi:MFS transporter, CP family, cyanate transporter